jgi:hypothetical protein
LSRLQVPIYLAPPLLGVNRYHFLRYKPWHCYYIMSTKTDLACSCFLLTIYKCIQVFDFLYRSCRRFLSRDLDLWFLCDRDLDLERDLFFLCLFLCFCLLILSARLILRLLDLPIVHRMHIYQLLGKMHLCIFLDTKWRSSLINIIWRHFLCISHTENDEMCLFTNSDTRTLVNLCII